MNRNQKAFNQTTRPRLVIANPCRLKMKPIKPKIKMRVKEEQIIRLVTKHNQSIAVATDEQDGKLHIVDKDGQLTRDILPDSVYSSEGLSDFQVKNGKFVKSKFSLKAGIKPMATKIPFTSITQKMERGQQARKKEISDMRMTGKI